jgi:2-keto-3-deoxy-L-rhamnonate aldolase RhmA
MNRILTVIAVGLIFMGPQAFAVDAMHPSTVRKHRMIVQIIGCMKRRMSADKIISYNEVQAACKDQISKRSATLTAGTLVASDTPTKP